MILFLSLASLVLCLLPTVMFLNNLPLFRCLSSNGPPCDPHTNVAPPSVSVLVPARDEASGIGSCLQAALASDCVTVEVVVLDDDSTDSTAAIVSQYQANDPRVRLILGKPLPAGWNGKQHACKQLADAAAYERFVFIDADVRLTPDALGRLLAHQDHTGVALLSAFPHQTTGTWLEKWLIPIMHFILLGYLPFARMRSNSDASLAAGCGQLFLTKRDAYLQAGTHEAIKGSRHDGVKLPRVYREAGMMTDVVDGTELAECRMYRGAREVVRGVLKNATEGIANPRLIVVFSVLLIGCSLLPLVALFLSIAQAEPYSIAISSVAILLSHVPRLLAAVAFRQSWFGALCHVPATAVFLVLQWVALVNHLRGRQVAWRGRTES